MLSEEQLTNLEKFIPESDTVRMVYKSMHPDEEEETSWDLTLTKLIKKALNGDKESLFNLLELTYLNAFNEGELAIIDIEENGDS